MSDPGTVIDSKLLVLLVCPADHAQLELSGSSLVCSNCGRVYPIINGIPNMVIDE